MAQNFLPCDRDQELLLPPSLRDWLPEDHLAWFVLDAVGQLDLEPFYASYRRDGWGAAAHEPRMMVSLLVYAYSIGVRSARGIERRCREDVAFRVICANQVPDHATIARFRARHEQQWAENFDEFRLELRELHDGGDRVVGLLELSGQTKRAALPMRMEIGAVYSGITDGRVAGLRLFSSWSGALEAASLRE